MLLREGGADVNLLDGAIMRQAVLSPDPVVLEEVLGYGTPSASSITHSLRELVPLHSTEDKARKLDIILSKSTLKQDLDLVLAHEVQSVAQGSAEVASTSALKLLLSSGADPNAHNAAALYHAVIAAKTQIVDLLFTCRTPPNPGALDAALPHALRISEPMERLTLTKKLVQAGASPFEINHALIHAMSAYSTDISLLSALASGADTSDGEALRLSASKESPEMMDLLLSRNQSSIEARSSALAKVMTIKDRKVRAKMCLTLLATGISAESTSGALLIAARDGDRELGDVLIANGASIESNNGQGIVEACQWGSAETLGILLKADTNTSKETLLAGFDAATKVRNLDQRADVFEQLLKRGVSGVKVDSQLESAVRSGNEGQAVLRVLLSFGANPNHNNGECVVLATRSAFIECLDLLLGLSIVDGSRVKRNGLHVFSSTWLTYLNREVCRSQFLRGLLRLLGVWSATFGTASSAPSSRLACKRQMIYTLHSTTPSKNVTRRSALCGFYSTTVHLPLPTVARLW